MSSRTIEDALVHAEKCAQPLPEDASMYVTICRTDIILLADAYRASQNAGAEALVKLYVSEGEIKLLRETNAALEDQILKSRLGDRIY